MAALPAHGAARWLAVAYGLGFGLLQMTSGRGHAPTSTWQVPSSWVRHRPQRAVAVIWGALLGPGLVTRNPYATIWMVLLLLASLDGGWTTPLVGAVAGLLQGGARAAGVLREAWRAEPREYLVHLLGAFRWRVIDGAVLIAIAVLVATNG